MNVPTFLNSQWVDENGYLQDSPQMYMDELNRAMQGALSDNGWTLPQITPTQLQTNEANADTQMPDGTMWYTIEEDPSVAGENEIVVKVDGALKKLSYTAWP